MKNGLGMYDFKDEDELVEFAAGKMVDKFENPSAKESAMLKYQILQNLTQGTGMDKGQIGNANCMDVDSVDSDQSYEEATPSATEAERGPDDEKDDQDEPVDMMSADDESLSEHSISSSSSDGTENMDSPKDVPSSHLFDHAEMEDIESAVVMSPDYVVFRNYYFSTALVIISRNGIQVKVSATDHNQGSFSFRWDLEEIIYIKHKWLPRIGLVIITLRGLVKDAREAEDFQCTSDVDELKFAVVEPNWPEKQVKINSLSVKYLAVWNAVLDGEAEGDAENLHQIRHYFPEFGDHFEDVVYPKGDPDAVTIGKRDVDLLRPETFINDTIIDFYIKYLKNQIQPEERHRFHFFNSFFFRKLADLDKDPSSIADGRAAFLRVRKWTRKVDLFGKDYVFIPVNFNLHWSLIVICHPGEVANFSDENTDKALKVPCILHMDSIRGSHAGLKNLIQSYLCEEWKERNKETSEALSSKFLNLRFVSLELPQQENSFDCGLFLLHYLELFLSEAPLHFSPFKITKLSSFLNADWFPPAEASLKRTLIQKLIFKLLQTHYPDVNCDENRSSECSVRNENRETGVDVLAERLGPSTACHRNVSASQDDQGIEMTLLQTSSMRNSQGNDSSLVLREFFDPGASSGAFFDRLQSSFENPSFYELNTSISPRQRVGLEANDRFVCMTSGESNFHQISEISAPTASLPFSSRGFGAEASWNLEISMQGGHEIESESDTATCSDDSEDVGIIESIPVGHFYSNHNVKSEQQSPPADDITAFSEDPEISGNQASHHTDEARSDEARSDEAHNSNENEKRLFSQDCSLGQATSDKEIVLSLNSEMVENEGRASGTINDHLTELPLEQQAAKRPRLNPPVEEDRADDALMLSNDVRL